MMEHLRTVVGELASITQDEPLIISIMFLLSLVANIIQIVSFSEERKRYSGEKRQREKLSTLVDTYEDIIQFAKEQASDKKSLANLKEEIQGKSQLRNDLLSKIDQLENLAKKRVLDQAIQRNVYVLNQSVSEIERLRKEYEIVGEIPHISQEKLSKLKEEVDLSIASEYEFPKRFIYQSVLIFFIVWLAPGPLDSLIFPFLIKTILSVLLEAVILFRNELLIQLIKRNFKALVLIACFSVWYGFFTGLSSSVGLLLPKLLSGQLETILELITYPGVVVLSIREWKPLVAELKPILYT